jgi:hypothetical protein
MPKSCLERGDVFAAAHSTHIKEVEQGEEMSD